MRSVIIVLPTSTGLQQERPLQRGDKNRILLASIIVMFVTPGLLGYLSGMGNSILLVGGFLTYLLFSRPKVAIGGASAFFQVCFGVYCAVQAGIVGTINEQQPRNYLLYGIAAMGIGSVLARTITTTHEIRFFCKCFAVLLLPVTISQVITFVLQSVFSSALIPYFSFDTGKVIGLGQNLGSVPIAPDIYFPFTMGFSHFNIPIIGVPLPRALGYFREPGVYATYLTLSFLCWDSVSGKRRHLIAWGKLLNVCGLLLTGSTSGLAIFVGIFGYKALFVRGSGRRTAAALVGLAFAVAITVAVASSDIEKKAVSLYGSDQSRFSSILDSFQLLLQQPILGFGATATPLYQANEGINLLSALHFFGVIGITLYAAVIVSSALEGFAKESGAILVVLVLTICFSQPLYFDCVTFFFLNVRWQRAMLVSLALFPRVRATKSSLRSSLVNADYAQRGPRGARTAG